MTGLASGISSSDDSDNADTNEEESDTEEQKDAKPLHDLDLDGHDEREGNSHEQQIGYDVTDFIGVDPEAADSTAIVSYSSSY